MNITEEIKIGMVRKNKTMSELGTLLGLSRQTASKKINNPDLLTVRDIKFLERALEVQILC